MIQALGGVEGILEHTLFKGGRHVHLLYFSDHNAHRTIRRSINKRLLMRLFSYIGRFGLQGAFNEIKTPRILSVPYLYFMIKQFVRIA